MIKLNKIILTFVLLVFITGVQSQNTVNNNLSWTAKFESRKVFIENKGQFPLLNKENIKSSDVLYAFDDGQTKIYFTRTGVIYTFNQITPKEKENEIEKDEDKDEDADKPISHVEQEREEHALQITTDIKYMNWENANPNVEITASDAASDYFSYCYYDNTGTVKNINLIKGFNKITYKNLYPNIDVEYTFHFGDGIEYSLILHPGADVSNIKISYSGNLKVEDDGDLHIPTLFGDIIEHAPNTYYSENKFSKINSFFNKETSNSISLKLDNYDNTKTVIIDPWVQTPTLPNSNCVWECEKDGTGNVYIIGGDVPLKLQKYNATGALQWTYTTPWDTANSDWLGTFATDLAGNSYVTNGSTAALQKINTSAGLVYSVTGGAMDEYWNIAFNCDQTKLIIGGTRLTGIPLITGSGVIFDINTATGNVNSLAQVGWVDPGFLINNPNEVRSITSSRNARYYYLTLDSLGCIDQNIGVCPSSSPSIFKINSTFNLGYKCENYRPNNGNAGIMAVRANRYFLYSSNGTTIQQRSLATGAVLGNATIPGGTSVSSLGFNQVGNSGIDIDTCGNVFVGSGNALVEYDANLNFITSVATAFSVYDVAVSYSGNVIVAGGTGTNSSTVRTGYVQSFNMSACPPMTLYCCDANICTAGPFCSTDPPVTLSAATNGGTWSGTGITNSLTGVFSPSIAGPGVHTVYYTMSCGTDSLSITVNACANLTACLQTNGDISVSGGTAPYTWVEYVDAISTPITTSAECTACGYTWLLGQCLNGVIPVTDCITPATWTVFTTGTSITPPAGHDTLAVIDAYSNDLNILNYNLLPLCAPCPTLTITPASIVNVLCYNGSTGSFSASTTGGLSPYNYTLHNSSGTIVATYTNITGSQNFTGLSAGTYTLNVADNNSCPDTLTITITQPASALTASITSSTSPTCGLSDGSITATAGGGTPGYTYNWNTTPAQTTATASNIPAGSYTLTITDANGCTTTTSMMLNNSSGPSLSISSTNATCGQNNGTATVTATGGTGVYTYTWNTTPTQTTPTITNLPGGNYVVSVSDGICTITTNITVAGSPGVTANIINIANVTCGNSNGSATANVTSGTMPYTYAWNTTPVQTSQIATGLSAGTYTVTVTDADNCTQTSSVTITQPTALIASITASNNITCFGGTNGSATVNVTGGTPAYTYLWNSTPVQVTTTATGLTAGTYTVTATDASGCTNTATVTINQPTQIALNIVSFTNVSCFGGNNGSATVSASGGVTPYSSFMWDDGETTPTAVNLTPGIHSVSVTDANGCTKTITVTISQPSQINMTAVTDSILCYGQANGTITVNVSGGSPGYTYLWSTGLPGSVASNLHAGTYTCTVTDANGCKDSIKATVLQPLIMNSIVINADTILPCYGINNGTITIYVVGGTAPFTYHWNTGATGTMTLNNLSGGVYTDTITDHNGCKNIHTVVVTQPPDLFIQIDSIPESCLNTCDGQLTSAVTGGTPFIGSGGIPYYHYYWNTTPPQTTESITGLCEGTYNLTITDSNGCQRIISNYLGVNDSVVAGFSAAPTSGYIPLTVNFLYTGTSSPGNNYTWNFGDGTISNLEDPTHIYTLADTFSVWLYITNGVCKDSIHIFVYPEIPSLLIVPNVFTPNGDGYNDVFMVKYQNIKTFSCVIFDRWGKKIYEWDDVTKGWDGKTKGGADCSDGTYFYILSAEGVDGIKYSDHGIVTLLR